MHPFKQRGLGIIAGRDRVPASEAVWCMGRLSAPANYGWDVADDGTVAASDVIESLNRLVRTRRRGGRAVADAMTTLTRVGPTSWNVAVSWGPVGVITVEAMVAAAIVGVPSALGVWFAHHRDDTVEAAISSRAAQWLLLRDHPGITPPSWATHVRDLDTEAAVQAQDLAEHARGREDLDTPALTAWERDEVIKGVRANPLWLEWRQACAIRPHDNRYDVLEDLLEQLHRRPGTHAIATPEPLLLQTMNNGHNREQWGVKAVAESLDVKPSTVRSWLARQQMPEPAGRTSTGQPWWEPETISAWHATRPGKGNRSPRRTSAEPKFVERKDL